MCFRPVGAQKPIICPNCKKRVAIVAGYRPPNCPYCKNELPEPVIACPECGIDQPISNKVCGNCGFNGKPGSGDPAKRKQ